MESLIPPALRARLGDCRLASRQAFGGHGYGQHASRSRGAGLEFAQYRAYEPGDELRQIDWKLYARSDKFFVREAERDSPLTAWVLLDATASMGQPDEAKPGWSRLQAAKVFAASIFELALRQGDRFGLLSVGGDGLRLIPAGSGPRHRDRCQLELNGLHATGQWPAETALRPVWERIRAGDLALVLSDGFDEAVVSLSERLAAARRDLSFIQLLTAEERDFPFLGGRRFIDPEGGDSVLADGPAARDEFLARFAAAKSTLAARLATAGVRLAAWHLDEPLDQPLRQLFPARASRTVPERP